jgi:pyridoxal phosphate enzyme (YggS family)
MHKSVSNLVTIEKQIEAISNSKITLIAVTKRFESEHILPILDHGHKHFGENKVQEAMLKWPELKKKYKEIKLHLIGKLQTNKVKFIFPLFDYIHSLDNIRLAQKISLAQKTINYKPKIFVQVNIGNEIQKNGINENDLNSFLSTCQNELKLNIIGLMCIPPNDDMTVSYFKKLKDLNDKYKLKQLSMGMSADYLDAVKLGSTYVRIGTGIFGQRS